MSSGRHVVTYLIPEVPDASYPRYREMAGGDVRSGIATGCEHLLRAVTQMLPGSCAVELLFVFEPKGDGRDRRSRLNPYLCVRASNAEMAHRADCLIRGGPLASFYEFVVVEKVPKAKQRLFSGFQIVRRQDLIKPLYSCDYNCKIPDRYITTSPLIANTNNDYQMLDRTLDRVTESVRVSIEVQSADVSTQLHAHTEYLARLVAINRPWDHDEEDMDLREFPASDNGAYLRVYDQYRPLAYKDPLANDILRAERAIHDALLKPQLHFAIRATAVTESTARLIASVVAESAFREGSYQILRVSSGSVSRGQQSPRHKERQVEIPGQSIASSAVEGPAEHAELEALTHIAPAEELLGVFCLPVASCSPQCCRKNTDPLYVDERDLLALGSGAYTWASDNWFDALGIPFNMLTKHVFVSGKSGYGKTVACINTLFQLHERQTPFLVIECRKKEYRVLVTLKDHREARFQRIARTLEVYTPGAEGISPFRFNPFEIPRGIEVVCHIEQLRACIKASIPLSAGSLPALLGEALQKAYADHPDIEVPPTMTDLVAAIDAVLETRGYSKDTRADMQTAIEARLGVLTQLAIGRVFQCRHGISMEHLMAVPAVIELDELPQEQACLLALFLLSAIREHLKNSPAPENGPRYVVVIEEAHLLFGASGGRMASEEIADTRSAVAEFISTMLIELRALGVAVILSDQHPSSLDPGATKSVASMLAFRQTYSTDCEELQRSMLLSRLQTEELARLRPGQAFFYREGFFEPRLIRTPNLSTHLPLTPSPTDGDLRKRVQGEEWFQKARIFRIIDELDQLKEQMDRYDSERLRIAAEVKAIIQRFPFLSGQGHDGVGARRAAALAVELRRLRASLGAAEDRFMAGPYRSLSYLLTDGPDQEGGEIEALRASLKNRLGSVIQPGTQGIGEVIDRLVRNCVAISFREADHEQER